MMQEAVAEMRQNMARWDKYEEELSAYSVECDPTAIICDGDGGTQDPVYSEDASWDGQEEYPLEPDGWVPTIEEEIDTLQMSQPEIDQIYYWESLSDGSYSDCETCIQSAGETTNVDDLIRAAAAGQPAPGTVNAQFLPGPGELIGLTVVGYRAYRAWQTADRATSKADEYFGNLSASDTQRDAFRHIFANVHLRRYIGSFLAKQVMDWWEDQNPNLPKAKVMDLHNNDLGREVKYKHFRDHWFWDRWNWQAWARKVRDYVNDTNNGEFIAEWRDGNPTESEARAREQLVPDWRYIYFAH